MRYLALAALLLLAAPVRAQDTNRLFPLGGQRGTTVALQFPGMDKEESAKLLVDGPGIEAKGPFVKGAGEVVIAPDAAFGVRQLRLVGAKTATQVGLTVVDRDPELNLLLVKGAVPGHKNAIVVVREDNR